jgi:DNA-binding XRE family transcriptional regulator
MARPVRPLEGDGQVVEFAQGLRALRESAGLTLEDLAKRTYYSISTLSEATNGKKVPSLAVTLPYARACGENEGEWRDRWTRASAESGMSISPSAEPVGDDHGIVLRGHSSSGGVYVSTGGCPARASPASSSASSPCSSAGLRQCGS